MNGGCENLTKKGKLNSNSRWMERGNWVEKKVRRGIQMVISCGENRGEIGSETGNGIMVGISGD